VFLTRTDIEFVIYRLASELSREYSEPMPAFAFHGGPEGGAFLLESALAQPQQMFGGRYLHRTLFDKAAALMRSMVKDHPFFDGNKRMALASTEVFLLLNGRVLSAPQDEKAAFVLALAASQPATPVKHIAEWLRRNTVALRDIERVLEAEADAGDLSSSDLGRIRQLHSLLVSVPG